MPRDRLHPVSDSRINDGLLDIAPYGIGARDARIGFPFPPDFTPRPNPSAGIVHSHETNIQEIAVAYEEYLRRNPESRGAEGRGGSALFIVPHKP